MNAQQAIAFIHGIERFGSKPGLRRVRLLLEKMGNPQNRLRFVHVAGTNGKGSTCAMLSHILTEAGYQTGLYISPFVIDFCERIQVNNRMIPHKELAEITGYVKTFWEQLNAQGETPTEFEVVVAIAMEYFARQKCDIVVLEVGLGGRFDATNIIEAPLVSVITSLSIDHTKYLGESIEQIAMEKSGIIKPGGVTVTSPGQPPEALAVIMEHCAQNDNPLRIPGPAEIHHADLTGTRMEWGGQEWQIPLIGRHQAINAVTVLETCRALAERGITLNDTQIYSGILQTRFPARMEILCRAPLVLLDGGHNLAGVRTVADALDMLEGRDIYAVCGMSADKEFDACLSLVLPRCKRVVVTHAQSYSGAMPAPALAQIAARYCAAVECISPPASAFAQAAAYCGKNDVLLLFGSLYLAADLRPVALEWAAGPPK